jgi:hypothetical protein
MYCVCLLRMCLGWWSAVEAEHTAAREGVALFDLSSFGNYNDSTLTLVGLKSSSAKPPVMPLPHIEQLRVPSAARTRPYPLHRLLISKDIVAPVCLLLPVDWCSNAVTTHGRGGMT